MVKDMSEILVLVEGEKLETKLMRKLFKIYGIGCKHNIVSYKTNIYVLYSSLINELGASSDDWDIITHLKSRESNPAKKEILSRRYAETILIFDFEPHDTLFDENKIRDMVKIFSDSTQLGKLYINYPMVESFYHMKSIPDPDYNTYTTSLTELNAKPKTNGYKARVDRENKAVGRASFTSDKNNMGIVIRQNINKARSIINTDNLTNMPSSMDILESQLTKMKDEKLIAVLCTFIFYIVDFNPKLLSV